MMPRKPWWEFQPWKPEEIEAIRKGVASGLSASEIGRKLYRTRNSVISAARRYGIDLVKPRGSQRHGIRRWGM